MILDYHAVIHVTHLQHPYRNTPASHVLYGLSLLWCPEAGAAHPRSFAWVAFGASAASTVAWDQHSLVSCGFHFTKLLSGCERCCGSNCSLLALGFAGFKFSIWADEL